MPPLRRGLFFCTDFRPTNSRQRRMNEHGFNRKLATALRKRGLYVLKLNLNFAAGVPDLWVAGNSDDIWIECKWLPAIPVRDATVIRPNLSALQLHWMRERARQSVRVCAIIGTPHGAVILDRPESWSDGIATVAFRDRLAAIPAVVAWIGSQIDCEEPVDALPRPDRLSARRRGFAASGSAPGQAPC